VGSPSTVGDILGSHSFAFAAPLLEWLARLFFQWLAAFSD